ncbi:hypothetical protein BN59_01652 [Legionella massiliensis]|uniref:Uncharacterized protein n=1 Tax=Legionella massiliensis TaxID=1034943 RepID=A0A078KZY5_9GAMM|nr:hypothetical protein BN59_01652 [Legionella massiliensis]CEE13107.1 hypothetical protein BN1094_01652 [Legionella massiliensis]
MFGMTGDVWVTGVTYDKDVRHVELRETSPECGTVLILEIPHYVRDNERCLGDVIARFFA